MPPRSCGDRRRMRRRSPLRPWMPRRRARTPRASRPFRSMPRRRRRREARASRRVLRDLQEPAKRLPVTFRVLGIESSCDETACAIVDDGQVVRADVVASQHEVHARYGGVVPELASRAHILNVVPVVQAALVRAGAALATIDGISVTTAPGLGRALLL